MTLLDTVINGLYAFRGDPSYIGPISIDFRNIPRSSPEILWISYIVNGIIDGNNILVKDVPACIECEVCDYLETHFSDFQRMVTGEIPAKKFKIPLFLSNERPISYKTDRSIIKQVFERTFSYNIDCYKNSQTGDFYYAGNRAIIDKSLTPILMGTKSVNIWVGGREVVENKILINSSLLLSTQSLDKALASALSKAIPRVVDQYIMDAIEIVRQDYFDSSITINTDTLATETNLDYFIYKSLKDKIDSMPELSERNHERVE